MTFTLIFLIVICHYHDRKDQGKYKCVKFKNWDNLQIESSLIIRSSPEMH